MHAALLLSILHSHPITRERFLFRARNSINLKTLGLSLSLSFSLSFEERRLKGSFIGHLRFLDDAFYRAARVPRDVAFNLTQGLRLRRKTKPRRDARRTIRSL